MANSVCISSHTEKVLDVPFFVFFKIPKATTKEVCDEWAKEQPSSTPTPVPTVVQTIQPQPTPTVTITVMAQPQPQLQAQPNAEVGNAVMFSFLMVAVSMFAISLFRKEQARQADRHWGKGNWIWK